MIDKSKLKELALAATIGPWRNLYEGSGTFIVTAGEHGADNVAACERYWKGEDAAEANSKFIATANPAAILELLAEDERKSARIAELLAELESTRNSALEEVAKVIDSLGDANFDGEKLEAAIECISAIRSLATTTSTEPPASPAADVIDIPCWQERMGKSGRRECESLAIECMEAEIKDLRNVLERGGASPAPSAKQEPSVGELQYKDGNGKYLNTMGWGAERDGAGMSACVPICHKGEVIALVVSDSANFGEEIEARCKMLTAGNPTQTAEPIGFISHDTLSKLSGPSPYAVDEPAMLWHSDNPPTRAILPVYLAAPSASASPAAQQGWVSDVIRYLAQIPGNRANEGSGQLCITDDDLHEALEIYAPSILAAGSQQVPFRDFWQMLIENGQYDRAHGYVVVYEHHAKAVCEALAAAAPAVPVLAEQDDQARDAARYRWLRDSPWSCDRPELAQIIQLQQNALWDAEIDAAMTAPSLQQGMEGAES